MVAIVGHAHPLLHRPTSFAARVTNYEGLPLAQVRLCDVDPGNVTREARTNDQGNFQIAFPGGPGDYIMGYARIGYVFRQFEVKRLADEDVLIADARLNVIQLDTVVTTSVVQQRVNRNQQTPDVGGTERSVNPSNLPPEMQGDIASMAASLPGVLLVPGLDGASDGFSVLGLGSEQNSVTLNGVSFGANGLPRHAAISSSLSPSPSDVSRGGFSGANFNIRTGGGSNFRTRGSSVVLNAPSLMWSDRAAQALGTEYTNVSIGGVASGPIVQNKSFYNVSYQLGRNSRDNQSLLTTNALGLETSGVAADSVSRFLGILQQRGVPTVTGPIHNTRVSDNGSVFGSFDYNPPSSSQGHAFNLTFNGNWARQSPVGGGATQLSSASGDRLNWGGGVQGKHSGYIKLFLSEKSFGIHTSRDHGQPYLALPAGRVRVNSNFEDGGSGVQTLGFGGNQGLSSRNRSIGSSLQNTLSWFDDGNKHRIKLTTELQYNGTTRDQSSNLLGSFLYNSLGDLEAGIPASFTRTLAARQRSTGQFSGCLTRRLYRRTQDLQDQYGVRVDGSHYTTTPAFNSAIEAGIQPTQRSGADTGDVQPAHRFADDRLRERDRCILRSVARAARRCPRWHWRVHQRQLGGHHRCGARQHWFAEWHAADRVRGACGADRRLDAVCVDARECARSLRRWHSRNGLLQWVAERDALCAGVHAAAGDSVESLVERLCARRALLAERRRDVLAQPASTAVGRPELRADDTLRARRRPSCVRRDDEHRADEWQHRIARRAHLAGVQPREEVGRTWNRARDHRSTSPITRTQNAFGWSARTRIRTSPSRSPDSAARRTIHSRSSGRVPSGTAPDHLQPALQLLQRDQRELERSAAFRQPVHACHRRHVNGDGY